MRLYAENNNYKLYNGNMLELNNVIVDNSIDVVVTDPPYELGFMGKSWDASGIAFQKETWKKCFNALKPGGYLLAFGGSRTFHRIACAIEDAGFEIRDTIMWLYGCYSADTQVLTNKGWKYFYDLDKSEEILQWDKNTNKLSWIKPLNYFEYDIDDDMCLFENRHMSQLVTKNHKVACQIKERRKESGGYQLVEAQNIKPSWILNFPLAGNLDGTKTERDAYIIGWWLTDAWKHKDGKACMFSQSKPHTLNKLKSWFNDHNVSYSEYIKKSDNPNHKDEHTFYVTGDIANKLLTLFPNRKLTWDILSWDKESRKQLLEGLMDGDGSHKDGQYSRTFWSKDNERLDIFQALCISLNYRAYIRNNECVEFNIAHNSTQTQTKHHKPNIHYIGKVYCLQTETGAFVVRRNGKAFISGNSGFPKSMNIGLAIDKKNGKCFDERVALCNHIKDGLTKCGKSVQDLLGRFDNSTKVKHWLSPTQSNFYQPSYDEYAILVQDFGCSWDYYIFEADREKVGVKKNCLNNWGGKNTTVDRDITLPATDEAKKWDGWGTAMKPSFEPVIVARKPCDGTCVDNVLKWGVGGINIDECRVPIQPSDIEMINAKSSKNATDNYNRNETKKYGDYALNIATPANELGRFPANTILTYDDSDYDEVCGGFPQSKGASSQNNYSNGHIYRGQSLQESTTSLNGYREWYNDDGSASRYFMNCKFNERDNEIWKNIFANSAEKLLEIGDIKNESIAQVNVDSMLKELKDHYAKYVESQQDLCETFIAQDIAKILTWDFKIETSRVIQDFITNSKKCIQFQNLVQFVEQMDNIDTTQTTQNLLKLFGYVRAVITNYILGNLKCEQRRYIYSPKASKRDRDGGLEGFEEKTKVFNGQSDKSSTDMKDIEERFTTKARNTHPTVKPTSLMQYLVRLVAPKGATILDPFMGSGSTGKAAMYENMDRDANYKFIGIELTDEYLPIAKARIDYVVNHGIVLDRGEDEEVIDNTPVERFDKFEWDI